MPTVLLTERGRGARPDKLPIDPHRRIDYFDASTPGFMVRVTPGGARTFAVWYRVHGEARRLTIGPVGVWTLADARARATEILRDARGGIDAVAAKKAAEAEAQKAKIAGDDFEALARKCLEKEAPRLRDTTLSAYLRTLEHDVFPRIGRISPVEITRGHVNALIEDIAQRAPIQANRTLAVVKRIFSWAVAKDLLAADPCAGLRKPTEERHLERNFSNDEIRAIFEAARGTELGHLVPLLFYTGTRSGETRSAQWSDFDFERNVWNVPGDRRKVRRTRERSLQLPLSRGALAVLAEIPRTSTWLFPADTREGYLDPPQDSVETIRERSRVKDFRLHFIRHTVRSRMSECGVTPDIAERVLGHALVGMRRTYDAADYAPQMRGALEAWSAALDRILAGKEKEGADVRAFQRG